MTHGDLFAGIGGFALAARWCGIKTIWAVEIDPYCQAVYRKHFPSVEIYGDVKEILVNSNSSGQDEYISGAEGFSGRLEAEVERTGPDRERLCSVDLLTGGFPCQPFSVAGKRRGKADDRYLWPEMLRIIRAVHPQWIIAENVPGIDDATHLVLDTVTSDLEGIGYAAIPIEIPACAVGAPHRRQRVWVVAHSNSIGFERKNVLQQGRSGLERGSQDLADSFIRFADWWPRGASWWSREPAEALQDAWGDRGEEDGVATVKSQLGRVAHGIPSRVDRLRALGNAIVPQVAERIMRAILEAGERP